jgi:hypothetical protein
MVDFEKMIFEKPAYVGELLEEMLPYFEKGIYQPLSKKTFPVAQAREAFAYMSSGQHTGKIVISISPENVLLEKKASTVFPVRESATYLLTGGYGGLGLTFATYLVNRGATSLILTGRSSPSENAQHQIDFLIARGVDVRIEKMDAGNADDIHRVISSIPEDKPLKGVFHLAGLLEDASLMNLNEDAFYRVLHCSVPPPSYLVRRDKPLMLLPIVIWMLWRHTGRKMDCQRFPFNGEPFQMWDWQLQPATGLNALQKKVWLRLRPKNVHCCWRWQPNMTIL